MTQSRLMEKNALDEQEDVNNDVEKILRPQFLSDFTGQPETCANLKVFVQAAQKRNEQLDHILLSGPPGLGKTTLAKIIANELNVDFHSTFGPIISKAGDLAAILTNIKQNDVLFIDEIHRLNSNIEEVLYSAMEDFKLDIMVGEGPSAKSIKISLPQFTLIGATTRAGLLSSPLRDRFGIPLNLSFYDEQELAKIIKRASKILEVGIDEDACLNIASRSRGTPRIAIRLLRRIRDFATIDDLESATMVNITKKLSDMALLRLKIDKLGLDQIDHNYLKIIALQYNGGPVGIDTMAAVMSEQKEMLEEIIEPYLLQQGFVMRTPRGRMLSKKGFEQLGMMAMDINNKG